MNDHDPTPFGDALRERVRDERPDLDRLVDVSTRTGTRIRRRRQAGATLAGAAAVAAIAVGGQQLLGDEGTTSRGPGFATAPTTSAPVVPAETTVDPTTDLTPIDPSEPVVAPPGSGAPFTVTADGWTCSEPVDEKFDCTRGTEAVYLVWRDAVGHQKYLSGPDALGPEAYVSDVHGGVFVTIEPGPGTSAESAGEVGSSLVFD